MKISCPECSNIFDVSPDFIGKKVKCTSCANEFEVINPNLKQCPDCFGMISKRANTCPHCGAVIIAQSAPAQVKSDPKTPVDDIFEEKEILVCHPSKVNFLWDIILGIILAPLIIGIVILVRVYIKIKFTRYKITNLRVVITQGFIAKQQSEIWIKDMRGANLIQSVWQRITCTGNISIGTAATADAEIQLAGVPNPQSVVDTINALRHS